MSWDFVLSWMQKACQNKYVKGFSIQMLPWIHVLKQKCFYSCLICVYGRYAKYREGQCYHIGKLGSCLVQALKGHSSCPWERDTTAIAAATTSSDNKKALLRSCWTGPSFCRCPGLFAAEYLLSLKEEGSAQGAATEQSLLPLPWLLHCQMHQQGGSSRKESQAVEERRVCSVAG